LAGIAGIVAFSSPAPLAFAAYNDVTLTTNAVLSVNGITLNISASTSVIQSIMVNATSFSFTLGTGSNLQVNAPNRNQLSVDETRPPCALTHSVDCDRGEARKQGSRFQIGMPHPPVED
jgi:hypothetical protein